MKKIIGYVFVLMFVVFGWSGVAHAAAVVTIGSQSAANGASISVPVTVTGFNNSVAGMDFHIAYDPSLLTYTGYTLGAAFTGHGAPTVNPASPNFILNWFDSTALTLDSGTLLTLNFNVISASNTTANLVFSGTDLNDTSANLIASTFNNGAITLNAGASTTYTFSGPSSGTVNAASTNFTVTPNGTYTGTITITPSGAGVGSLTPTVLTFSNSSTAQTFTITPNATGSITLTPTNNGSLTNPSNLTYTSNAAANTYTFTGPSSGNAGSASTNFTVTPVGGNYTGTITITPSGAGVGSLTPTVLTFANSAAAQTFTITPDAAGSITLTPTNNHAITNPANLTYTSNPAVPGAPLNVVAVAGNTTATVTFTAPASNGGASITGYTVTSIPAGGTDSNTGTTGLSHSITGLTNGTSYTFTVKATNSAGPGPASSASNAVTPSAPKAITTFAFNALSVSVSVTPGVFTIPVSVPTGTTVTALVPTIAITGTSVVPASGVAQDFTNPVTYTVHASDGTTQAYVVTVTTAVIPSGGGPLLSGGTTTTTTPPPTNPTIVIPPTTNIPGCTSAVGFSTTTGQSCSGAVVISTGTSILGCNGTIGFSTVTGQSCANNTGGNTTVYTPPTTVTVITNNGPYNFGTVSLVYWSKGTAVKNVQRFLNAQYGLNLSVDGRLGSKTLALVKRWQKEHGITSNGVVGPMTRAAMTRVGNGN